MIYAATHALPGCLPDGEPSYFTSARDAWAHLADLYVEWEDDVDDGSLERDVFDPERTTPGTDQRRNPTGGLPIVFEVTALDVVETIHHGQHRARRVVTRDTLRESVYAAHADYDTIVSDLINKGDAEHGWCRYELMPVTR